MQLAETTRMIGGSFAGCAENGICHFGTLPGGWISSKGRALLPWQDDEELANMNFSVWQPYCSTCQLQPLLSPYLEVCPPQLHPPDLVMPTATADHLIKEKRLSANICTSCYAPFTVSRTYTSAHAILHLHCRSLGKVEA